MGPNEIAALIKRAFSEDVKEIKEFRGQVSITVKKGRVKDILGHLAARPEFSFDYLEDLCGVDYLGKKEPRFEVVYYLHSMKHRHTIRIKAEVPEDDCAIDSVVDIWAGADWHERECYDLFGITFTGHPDLRRILMPDDWEGHPLRKDYPLQSDLGDREWPAYTDVVATAKKNKGYEVR
jgi:NADH-quinone oxidoreductase subunit C